jgi:hypothetical protein
MRRTRSAQAAQLWRWGAVAVVIWAVAIVIGAMVRA